jgi:hypothetical protein
MMLEERYRDALEFIADKSTCNCWDVPAMGSGEKYRWVGCKLFWSEDPEEHCLTCTAHCALQDPRSG